MSCNGEAFEYDVIGNPTTYRGKAATWAYGRQLTSFDGNTFSYDARGRKTAKNDIAFTYDSNGNLIKQSNGLEFLYDHTGVFAVKHNGSTYFYRKDAQANVVALLDSNGAIVVKYKYDAWGNCKVLNADGSEITDSNHIGILNPFRYRSYYYDTGIGLYFLKTRYYDPEIGRFMTIDDLSYLDPESINGLNLYAYCLNNPVMMVDNSGCAPAWWQWLVSGLTLAAGIALCFVPGGQAFGVGVIVAGATSMTSNILSAAGVDGKVASTVTNALSIVGGIALCFTPFASIGASMIGSGVLGIAGGYVSEALGGSFELGSAIGNIVGGIIGDGIYKGLQSIGKAGVYVKLRNFKYNPEDDFIKLGPSDKALSYWRRMLSQNPRGYNTIPNMDGEVEVIKIIKHTDNMLANGHHRIYILRTLNNAPKYIKVFLTK